MISSSHCVAKAVVAPGRARHICYCHSPMRYAWDQFDAYFGPARVGRVASRWFHRPLLARLARGMRPPRRASHRFVAISEHVAGRIRRYYDREATVVYPPVDTDFYHACRRRPRRATLLARVGAGSLQADRSGDRRVRAAGVRACGSSATGPIARGSSGWPAPRCQFLGPADRRAVRDEYQQARAVILPGEEDFGIVPVEAQACGRPVVALARGGALETVLDGDTGVLFDEPTPESLAAAHRSRSTACLRRRRASAPTPSGSHASATCDAPAGRGRRRPSPQPPGTRW